ncbi:MAG: hypothetical protein PHT88_02395 [Candidatus Moranbacteria bacterium]|nr:hypothetical protein [Candidatus Moranbacteria bacterium]
MADIFEVLFGSKSRVRMLRLLLLNSEKEFSFEDLLEKTLLRKAEATKELTLLKKIKLVNERTKKNKKVIVVNTQFPFYIELKGLFSKSDIDAQSKAFQKLSSIGEVKLVLVSGVFLNYAKSKADMILVVNNVNRAKLKSAMSYLEAEIGRDIRFVLMNNEELQYRLNMMDRFLMEFLEHSHQEIINKAPELKRFVAGLKR